MSGTVPELLELEPEPEPEPGPQAVPSSPATDALLLVSDAAAAASAASAVALCGGAVLMPVVGLGGGIFTEGAEEAVLSALQLGYRLIDTAPKYGGSEAAIGRALQTSGIPRAEVFLATKVTNSTRAPWRRSRRASPSWTPSMWICC